MRRLFLLFNISSQMRYKCCLVMFFFSLITDLVKESPMMLYCTSVYWVVATMTSTGYGDVHADNNIEMGEFHTAAFLDVFFVSLDLFRSRCLSFLSLPFLQFPSLLLFSFPLLSFPCLSFFCFRSSYLLFLYSFPLS